MKLIHKYFNSWTYYTVYLNQTYLGSFNVFKCHYFLVHLNNYRMNDYNVAFYLFELTHVPLREREGIKH